MLSAGNHSSPQTSPFLGLSCMESLAIGMGLFGSFGSPEDAEVPRWEQAQVAPEERDASSPAGFPRDPTAMRRWSRGRHLPRMFPR